jgi:hypothetical protein
VLIRTVTIQTLDGPKQIQALFDTGANVFILSQEIAPIHNIFVMEREKPISLLGFSGQEETSFGKYFTPLIDLRIGDHISQISCEIGPLDIGVDLIITGEWFMVEHRMSFEGNEIQVQQHIYDPESIISYNETLLDDEETVWVGSLTTTKAPNKDELQTIVPEAYHKFIELFGKPLVQELPPHQTFDHQIQIKEGKEVLFGLIYHLSEKELGALREYLECMLAQGKITEYDTNMGAPIKFIPKPNRKRRLCVDSRGLNAVTIKYPYPLPLMDKLRDRVVGCE